MVLKNLENIEGNFIDLFKEIPNHRVQRTKFYSCIENLLLSLCAVICSCESWKDIENLGKTKISFLRNYLPYKRGFQTDDTIRLFFRNMDPAPFSSMFRKWVEGFGLESEGMMIAIDGKTSRGSRDGKGTPFHLISAFAAEQGIVL